MILFVPTSTSKDIDKILLVSATNKNKYTLKYDIEVPKCSTKYLETKKRSIACTKLIIEQNENWAAYFNSHKKKDDLADCLLQCYQFINYCPVLPIFLMKSSKSTDSFNNCIESTIRINATKSY